MQGLADACQRNTFEALAHLGPAWSAIAAGFAVADWRGQMHLTPAGERYLSSIGATEA